MEKQTGISLSAPQSTSYLSVTGSMHGELQDYFNHDAGVHRCWVYHGHRVALAGSSLRAKLSRSSPTSSWTTTLGSKMMDLGRRTFGSATPSSQILLLKSFSENGRVSIIEITEPEFRVHFLWASVLYLFRRCIKFGKILDVNLQYGVFGHWSLTLSVFCISLCGTDKSRPWTNRSSRSYL